MQAASGRIEEHSLGYMRLWSGIRCPCILLWFNLLQACNAHSNNWATCCLPGLASHKLSQHTQESAGGPGMMLPLEQHMCDGNQLLNIPTLNACCHCPGAQLRLQRQPSYSSLGGWPMHTELRSHNPAERSI
jgi:hypothetical protein